MRYYDATRGRLYQSLGTADDLLDADGDATLTFAQAQDAARTWFEQVTQTGAKPPAPVTVAETLDRYLEDYRARGGKALGALQTAVNAHILPALGSRELAKLSALEIKRWHAALSKAPARVRTVKGATQTRVDGPTNSDAERARRATANRVLTILKAALNLAFRDGHAVNDEAWRRVRPFQKVEAPRIRFLMDDEARRLVNACPEDLRQLVIAALLTGCRYGELTAMKIADFDLEARTMHVPEAKGGRPRHVALTDEAVSFFKDLVSGRTRLAHVLRRNDGAVWGKNHQSRPLALACVSAAIDPVISFHVLRHTYASRLARAGVPMLAIAAQLGHVDTRITVKHYAHLSPDHIADAVRAGFADMALGRQ
ncbi:MAG: tyrosine-type recombinase/integrase [Janthinobacterium lividum]